MAVVRHYKSYGTKEGRKERLKMKALKLRDLGKHT